MQKSFGRKKVIMMFLLPAFIVYTLFVVVSVVWAGYYSLFDWSGVGEKTFLGLKNYLQLFTNDPTFWATVAHTLIYTVICVLIQVFGGLHVCHLFEQSDKIQGRTTDVILCTCGDLFRGDLPDIYKAAVRHTARSYQLGIGIF